MQPHDHRDSVLVLDEQRIGLEARATPDDHLELRLWLRLLTCSTQIEQEIRSRLRERFGTTPARFDYLAQLERHPDGLRMGALSRHLMVTGGSITGLTSQLVSKGWVERFPDPDDGRAHRVRLTSGGRAQFRAMAAEHESWLAELLASFGRDREQHLLDLLGQLRTHLAHANPTPSPATARRPEPSEAAHES